MLNEPRRSHSGPWQCPYCGTGVNAPSLFCPQCGASQRAAPSFGAASNGPSPQERPHDFAYASRGYPGAQPANFAGDRLFGSDYLGFEYGSRYEENERHRSWLPFLACGSLIVCALLFVVHLISQRNEPAPGPGVQVVNGSVLGPQSVPPVRASRRSASSVKTPKVAETAPAVEKASPPVAAPAPSVAEIEPPVVTNAPPVAEAESPVAAPTPPAVASVPRRQELPMPADTAPPDTAQQSVAVQRSLPEARVFPRRSNATTRADATRNIASARDEMARHLASERAEVARNIASARASLDKDNLEPARGAIMNVLAVQPGNGSALQMQADLASREHERDALLGYARLCEREGQWTCMWENAGRAVSMDTSSAEAKWLLSHAMVEHATHDAQHYNPDAPLPPDFPR